MSKFTKWVFGTNILESDFDEETIYVDSQIFTVVVELNRLGVHTVASCEGHLDHGAAGPWVDIEADVDTAKLEEQISGWRRKMDELYAPGAPESAAYKKACKKYHQLSAQIRELRLPAQAQIIQLLADFYLVRRVQFDVHLHSSEIFADGSCRLENQGVNIQDIRTLSDKTEKLKAYQAEMAAFGEWLKTRKAN